MGNLVASQGIQGRSQTLTTIARVIPDVTGIDKIFDYVVPDDMVTALSVGDRVRTVLHGRSISCWVQSLGLASEDFSSVDQSKLLSLAKIQGLGPDDEVVALLALVRSRWHGRMRSLFVSASPSVLVQTLPSSRRSKDVARMANEGDVDVAGCVADSLSALVRRGPKVSPMAVVLGAASNGPTLVIIPTINRARLLAAALKRSGLTVAVMPDDWANAAGGVDVVIGARSAVFARVPHLRSIVVVDEHDDSLQEERTPTWHARDVAIMRAEHLGISCILCSPVPSVSAVHWARNNIQIVSAAPQSGEWPEVRIIDRSLDEEWPSSLVTSALVSELRDHSRRIALIYNAKGRARLVACASCKQLTRCEACQGALGISKNEELVCARCSRARPHVCLNCGAGKFAVLKPGVTRLREELALTAGRRIDDVVEVSGSSKDSIDGSKHLFIGTESLLHRVKDIDTVVFLDMDQELSAPKYRASEIAATLLIGACRMVARSDNGGRVLVQTHNAHHPLLTAVVQGDVDTYLQKEMVAREAMMMPPYSSLVQVSGIGAPTIVAELKKHSQLTFSAANASDYLVRSDSWQVFSQAFQAVTIAKGIRFKLTVDPPRV